MSELVIRRNRGFSVVPHPAAGKTEKPAGSSQTQKVSGTAGFVLSETLRQLMTKGVPTEVRAWESRRMLQTGEGVLAEVQEKLDRIAELARESAGEGEPDRAALQTELEQLQKEIDRIMSGAVVDDVRLFLDEALGFEGTAEGLLYAAMSGGEGKELIQAFPAWLLQGIAQNALTTDQLLAALGLDKTADISALLEALAGSSLEDNPAAGYLAALYLGAVISGGTPSGPVDLAKALEGLQQLLEKAAEGLSPDEAVELLTNGAFASIADFQAQFTGGTAPGLESFLTELLLLDSGSLFLDGSSVLSFLAGIEGMNLDLLMGLLDGLQGSGGDLLAMGAEAGAGAPGGTAGGDALPEAAPDAAAELGTAGSGTAAEVTAHAAPELPVLRFGTVQVTGRDLSGVSFHESTGELTIEGEADVTVQGTGQEAAVIRLAGSGTVTLQRVNASVLTVDAAAVRVLSAEENVLGQVQLREGAVLTISGGGLLRMGSVHGNETNTLRLSDGAVVVMERQGEGEHPGTLALPVLVDGPVFLAAQAGHVSNPEGKPLDPFDIVWKTMLPGWNAITALELDGRQAKMALFSGDASTLARLWLEKGDPSHGYLLHNLTIWGEDEFGRPRTRYAYLHWNQSTGAFQEASVYPNPFVITGGEPDVDWTYEEASQTLHILSNQVDSITGGPGIDTNQTAFSGRIALADRIGVIELTLGGVNCRARSGRALSLGRENDVTLLLGNGTSNSFRSGRGCAGISLGDGTALAIDRADPGEEKEPVGSLIATGGAGGAGIGRDSGESQDRTSRILIRGGVITATGTGGGAGIGAGKDGFMGSITITGGIVISTGGKEGGAGIGGALGAPVGDISIRGGTVTAAATYHAAAIGAGIRGKSGDILIAAPARIAKATGGNPGADIGACLFGGCGDVRVSGGADLGNAKIWTRTGVSMKMGEDTVTLPRFRLSPRVLRLDDLDVSTREYARAAKAIVEADRRWVAHIQAAYNAMYVRLEQSFRGFQSIPQYLSAAEGLVRDAAMADTLLNDMRQSIRLQSAQAMRTHYKRDMEDIRQLLL